MEPGIEEPKTLTETIQEEAIVTEEAIVRDQMEEIVIEQMEEIATVVDQLETKQEIMDVDEYKSINLVDLKKRE